jgi:hypothetical protein
LPALPIQKTSPGPAANYIEMKGRRGITAFGLTRGPNGNTNTHQYGRQARTVESMRSHGVRQPRQIS